MTKNSIHQQLTRSEFDFMKQQYETLSLALDSIKDLSNTFLKIDPVIQIHAISSISTLLISSTSELDKFFYPEQSTK